MADGRQGVGMKNFLIPSELVMLSTFTQHIGRQEVDTLPPLLGCLGRLTRAALGAAASELAALAAEGSGGLPDGVDDAEGDEGEDEGVLEPGGHGSCGRTELRTKRAPEKATGMMGVDSSIEVIEA